MKLFKRKPETEKRPVVEHPRFVVGDDHHRKPLKVEKPIDPETKRLIDWRKAYDANRKVAFEAGLGCGRCINGLVYFGPNENDHTCCNCRWVRKEQ